MLLSFDVVCYAELLWQQVISIVTDNLKVSVAYTKKLFSPSKGYESVVVLLDLAEIGETWLLTEGWVEVCCVCFLIFLGPVPPWEHILHMDHHSTRKQANHASMFKGLMMSLLLTLHWLKQIIWLNPLSLRQGSMYAPPQWQSLHTWKRA